MKLSQQHRFYLVILFAFLLGRKDGAAASDFTYFQSQDLNFWKESVNTAEGRTTPGNPKPSPDGKIPQVTASSAFPWQKYMDPKNEEFFKEGDYTPPAPFMEIARNPSDSNIENWFHYLETKNLLLHRLQDRLTAYTVSHPRTASQDLAAMPPEMARAVDQAPPVLTRASARLGDAPPPRIDAKRFRMRLYFDSHCPHCEHMLATTIRELSKLGYWIELRQVDRDEAARARIPFPVSPASSEELKQYGVESVPVLLVGDLKAKSFFKMQGYQTTQTVLDALKTSSR